MDKPFALFGGNDWIPGGGMDDLHGTYATLHEALSQGEVFLLSDSRNWYHVADLRTMQIVARSYPLDLTQL